MHLNIIGEFCVLRCHDRINFESEFPTGLDFVRSVITDLVGHQEGGG